jgi:hypothetical protein
VSARENIAAAVVKALSGTTGVGTNIFRARTDAIDAAESPALVVLLESETPAEDTNGYIDVRLTFVVDVHARADAQPDKSADAACASVHSKLMTDPTLGGLLVDLSDLSTEWEYDQSDQALVVVHMRFVAWYRRSRTSLN